MMKHTPYVYLIGWSDLDTWYCGCEYGSVAKTAHPDNLFKTYFTSSKYVHKFREEHGNPDIIKVIGTFSCGEDALKFEEEYLLSINAAANTVWLNESNGGKNFKCDSRIQTEITKHKISESKKGCKNPWAVPPHTPELHARHSKTMKRLFKEGKWTSPTQGKKHKEESKKKMSKRQKNRPRDACPHCGTVMDIANLNRWHGDNCRKVA